MMVAFGFNGSVSDTRALPEAFTCASPAVDIFHIEPSAALLL